MLMSSAWAAAELDADITLGFGRGSANVQFSKKGKR